MKTTHYKSTTKNIFGHHLTTAETIRDECFSSIIKSIKQNEMLTSSEDRYLLVV